MFREDLHGDVGGPRREPRPSPSTVRRMTAADVDWGVALGRTHYPGEFDEASVRAWALARIAEPSMVFLRTDHAFLVGHLAERYNAPGRKQAFLTLLYAEPGNYGREVLRLVEGLRDWAAERGAAKVWIGDVSGHDLGRIAEMLGGRFAGRTYVVDLGDSGSRFG